MPDALQVEMDVIECLRAAIALNGQTLSADQIVGKKPGDSPYDYKAEKYLFTLDETCGCLRAKGYELASASREKARELVGKTFSRTILFLADSILAAGSGVTSPSLVARATPFLAGVAIGATVPLVLRRKGRGK